MEAFYLPTDDPSVFEATRRTEGLWNPNQQHAGPPSALLTRAVEGTPSSIGGTSAITRLTVEILGPVPTGEVAVQAAVTRPGRAVELVEAELSAAGRVAMRARAWRIRTVPVRLPDDIEPPTPPPAIPAEPTAIDNAAWTEVYLGAVEWRFVRGHWAKPGPAMVWARLRLPLVAGEEPSPMQRLVAVADSGNGLSGLLDFDTWWYINTELTIHLHRPPAGEWVGVDALTTLSRDGIGLAETVLYDESGRTGRGAQSLMVGPR